MNIQPFYSGDTYKTKERKGVLKVLTSLRFYLNVIDVTIQAGNIAQRGRYGDSSFYKSSIDAIRALESVGAKFDITGLNNINKVDGPCVFIANHMSILETYVIPCMILPYKKVTFIVKKSLMQYPFLGNTLRAVGAIVVSRENPRKDLQAVFTEGVNMLKAGTSLIVFPQSTRTTTFVPAKFNTIGIKLALKANVPIVPVALKTDVCGNGKILKDFGPLDTKKTVYFAFDTPRVVTGRGTDEHQYVISFIQNKLSTWQ
ncbi:MAG: 1-acyl-sn-glycerol-3-phosphate acyltransferase [Candidatus Magnetoovum sp. WYHC-5]|nr:1-acyl-sn-glycerol-3-phosphate acyltransferase [Candidatus Magnetoovum sp. WYHC-5]